MRYGSSTHLIVGVFLLSLCGCVRKTVEGDTSTYTMEWWAKVGWIALGLVFAGIGMFLFSKKHLYRGALVTLVGIAFLFASPDMFTQYAIVDSEKFVTSHGTWYSGQVTIIAFDDVEAVEISVTTSTRRFRTRQHYSLHCKIRERDTRKVPIGEIMEEAMPDILAQIQRRKIPTKGFELLPNPMK